MEEESSSLCVAQQVTEEREQFTYIIMITTRIIYHIQCNRVG